MLWTPDLIGQVVYLQKSLGRVGSVRQASRSSPHSFWDIDGKSLLDVKVIYTVTLVPLLRIQGGLQQSGTVTLIILMSVDPAKQTNNQT